MQQKEIHSTFANGVNFFLTNGDNTQLKTERSS